LFRAKYSAGSEEFSKPLTDKNDHPSGQTAHRPGRTRRFCWNLQKQLSKMPDVFRCKVLEILRKIRRLAKQNVGARSAMENRETTREINVFEDKDHNELQEMIDRIESELIELRRAVASITHPPEPVDYAEIGWGSDGGQNLP
jgi:hypothetical protein